MERTKVQERGTSLAPSKREGLVLVETCNDIHWRGSPTDQSTVDNKYNFMKIE